MAIVNKKQTLKDKFKFNDSMTTWINKTKYTANFKLIGVHSANNIDGETHCGEINEVTLAPGEKVDIFSVFDNAIRTIDKNSGLVVGGLCPWLDKVKEDDKPEMHSCLDFETIMDEDRISKLSRKLIKDRSDAEAIKILNEEKFEEETKPRKNAKSASV